jgi:purine-binding chemotaxis protein CheW
MDARVRAVLDERARVLARPLAAQAGTERLDVLTLSLAGERYAVESRYVVEVFKLRDLALLPGAERPVLGATAWRGGLLTVLDLRTMLGLPAAALDDLGYVVVLGGERPAFGILADVVHDVVGVATADVGALPDGVAAIRTFLKGVAPGVVLVLDAAKLLSCYT